MDFYFIRHGQSENNLLWASDRSYAGRVADPALTVAGEQQAEKLAAFLADSCQVDIEAWDPQNIDGFRLTHLYTSLMERAVATGHKVAEALDLPLLGWIDIHEAGGMFLYDEASDTHIPQPGRGRTYLEQHYPRLVVPDTVTDAGWWNRPFEPREARDPRARRVVAELLARHGNSEDGVVFFSHGGFYNHLLRVMLGLPEADAPWFAANNTSITRLHFDDDSVVVMYQNRVDFLPPDLIT